MRKVLITFVTTKSCSVVNLEAERKIDIEDILNAFQRAIFEKKIRVNKAEW